MELNSNNVMKLEGAKNWNIWKFQTTVLLRGQGWLDIVEGRTLKPEETAARTTWEASDAKAQTLLVTRMSEDVMLHLISCTTSAGMWKKLLSVYEQKSETSIHIIQQRFFQYKYDKGTEMSVFLSKIQELQNQLKQMGEEISDKFVITKVLMSLPDEYKHFVSAWESAPDDKQTFDNLVARLLVEEERVKEKTEGIQDTPSSSAFIAKRNAKCFKCGKTGHFQTECRYNKDNDKKMNGSKCFYCGKFGHYKAQCRFKKSKENKTSNAFVMSNMMCEQYEKSKWLVDSGASEHMCRDLSLFSSFTSTSEKSVIVGNGDVISALGYGQIVVQVNNGREWLDTTIDNALYVPDLKQNLLSMNRVADRGYVIMTNDNLCKFYKNDIVCAIANRVGNSYYMDFRYNKCEVVNVSEVVKNDLYEWHERLAHQNFDYVKKILKENNIEIKQINVPQCESCLKGKIHRLPFKRSETVSTRTCEIIHGDTCGPMEEESIGGSRYFVVLKDDYSNYRTVYFVKNKHEIKRCLEDFFNKAENVTGNKIKIFRTDNGLEFINREVMDLCSKRGIIHQTTVTYTPEQNGKAERENRTLVEAARTMLHAKNLPKKLWAEAVNTAAFVLNRTGKGKDGKSPFEMWTNKKYNIHQLKVFGSLVFVHIPKEKRRKWDQKGEKGVMVGYGEHVKGYRIYFPEKNYIDTKRDIIFLNQKEYKEAEPTITLDLNIQPTQNEMPETVKMSDETENGPDDTLTDLNIDSSTGESEFYSDYEPSDEGLSDQNETLQGRRERSQRVRKQTSFYQCQNVVSESNEPTTYKEAIKRPDASKWLEAIERELQTLKDNHTWEMCDAPVNDKVVSCKWVFKIKRSINDIPQYKARLVARGFEQDNILDFNDLYAPVAKLSTLRMFIVIATKLKKPIFQMDVTGAFLYGEISGNVYVSLPEGAYSGENNIAKLNKSLYGLKTSPKCWNNKFSSVMLKEGYVKSNCDSCLYMKCDDNSKMYVLLYVDDILIFGTNDSLIMQLKNVLSREFKMKDLGVVKDFLGINIKQNIEKGITELSQRKYLENVLKKFQMENCKPISTPIDPNFNAKIFNNNNTVDNNTEKLCRKIIGCLMYAVVGTRPDLCFTVSLLSRYQKCANDMLLTALKRVLRYVKHTLNYKLIYKCNDDSLEGFCDADWGGDLTDRKSTSGYLFKYSNCLISWSSKKQASVSLSSTESEYVAVSVAASEACWLINLLNDFKVNNVCPVNIYCDNQSAMSVACSDTIKRLKHIDIRYHFVRELIKDKKLSLKYVETSEQPADMLTKALNRELITRFLEKCNVGSSLHML